MLFGIIDTAKLLTVLTYYGCLPNGGKVIARVITALERKIEKLERNPVKNRWALYDLYEERNCYYGWTPAGNFVNLLNGEFPNSNHFLPSLKAVINLFFSSKKSCDSFSNPYNSSEVAYFKNKKLRDLLEKLTPPSPVDNYALLSTLTNVMSISEGFFMPIFSNPPPKPTPHETPAKAYRSLNGLKIKKKQQDGNII